MPANVDQLPHPLLRAVQALLLVLLGVLFSGSTQAQQVADAAVLPGVDAGLASAPDASSTAAERDAALPDADSLASGDASVSAPRLDAHIPAPDLSLPQDPALAEGAPTPLETGDETTNLKYLLERVEVVGNHGTKVKLIKKFVPLEVGEAFDVNDPEIEALRYRLLGTGWYDSVELHLKRGTRPGWVVLVIEVEERRTLVFQQLAAGVGWSVESAKMANGAKPARTPEPYLGLSLADTNFLGTGKTLGGEVLVSPDQQGLAISYNDPVVRSSHWGFHTRGTFVNGQEYFGGANDVKVSVNCMRLNGTLIPGCETKPDVAVVDYWRTGLTLGTARDVGSFTRFTLDWHGDHVRVPPGDMPEAATQRRGRGPEALVTRAIDFSIEPANSFVSMLSVGFTYDKRDSAILPSRGTLASFMGDLASPLIGSSYEFVRLQTSVNQWFSMPWGHTIRVGAYAGAVFGRAPFFYKFFVSDLTDLQPSRILGLNLDHRPAPNLFGVFSGCKPFDSGCGTAVAQMRQEELAARIDAEYVWPLVRGRRKFVKSADAFVLAGLYALADPRDLQLAIPGYSGLARLPIDLTIDLGVRLDTQVGVFQIGLAKLMWLPFK